MKTELSGHHSLRSLALAAIPTIGMMIITSIYSVVDGYFVSNFAGKTEFAAMNIIWPVIALVSAVAAFVRTLVFELATIFILPHFLGIDGIWSAVCVAEILAFVLTVALITAYRGKYLCAKRESLASAQQRYSEAKRLK